MTVRDWIDRTLLTLLYALGIYWTFSAFTAPPANLTGKPCGGSIHNHWQWGGTPDHIVPVCIPVDAQSAKR